MAALWRELHAVQQQLNMVAGVKQAHCIAQGIFRRFISADHQHCLTDMAGQCGSRRSGKDRWGIEDHNPSGMRRRKAVQHRLSPGRGEIFRSEEHTSELQSLMRITYAVFCLTKKKK